MWCQIEREYEVKHMQAKWIITRFKYKNKKESYIGLIQENLIKFLLQYNLSYILLGISLYTLIL